MGETQLVGMAQIKVTGSQDTVLTALGLGSCIAICAYDAEKRIAGLAHVVLPDSGGNSSSPGKFADTAVPLLVRSMTDAGAVASRIRVVLIGGAQLFAGTGSVPQLEIGSRNAKSVVAILQRLAIPIAALDIGGFSGRTVHFFANGLVRVKTIGTGEKELNVLNPGAQPDGRTAVRSAAPVGAGLGAQAAQPVRGEVRQYHV
jgi:chemotaxis protein CheD